MEIGQNWHKWKQSLGKAVHIAKSAGISEEHISEMASKIGNVLADDFDPANREQRLMKDLWDVSTEEERRTLATLMVKMTDKEQS